MGIPRRSRFVLSRSESEADANVTQKLRHICVDKAPQNPDEMIIQCGNRDCRKWLHVKCIAEAAVQETGESRNFQLGPMRANVVTAGAKKSKQKIKLDHVPLDKESSAVAIAERNSVRAEVFIKGTPEGGHIVPSSTTELVMTTADGQRQAKELCCLFCGSEIE